jgi:RsmE family RNA methyltransferase
VNLIIVAPEELAPDGTVTLAGVRARHLTSVLRVTPGQSVRVGVIDGPFGAGVATALADGVVSLQCTFDETGPGPPAVDVLLALPRPKVLHRLWAQLAALGVGRIMLTNADRVERNYFDTHVLDVAIYRPLLIEGLQQARDTWLPRVTVHRQFRVLVEDHLAALCNAGVRLVADPSGRLSIREAVAAAADSRAGADGPRARRVLLAIGPEGGWNAFELGLLATHGFHPVSMGTRTLRSDTACVALLALAHDAL